MKNKLTKKRKSEIWDLTKKIIGIIFIILGLIGLVVPILQGFLFIIIGIALYENKSIKESLFEFAKKIKKKVKKEKKK